MIKQCSILVPYRPENERRRCIGEWQWRYLAETFPGTQVVRCDDGAVDGPFCRARALNRARQLATADVLWCMDVDAAPHRDDLAAALAALAGHDWLVVYAGALQLDEVGTRYALQAEASPHTWNAYTRRGPAHGLPMLTAALWDRIGGWDEDYIGWGYEDADMVARLTAAAGKPPPPPVAWIRTLGHPRNHPATLTARNADRYNHTHGR